MSSPVWLWLLCDEIPISWLCQYKLAVWWLELNDCVLTLIIIDINKYNLASWWSWPLHFCIAGSSTKRDYWPVKLLTIWKSTSDCFSQTKEIISLFLSFNIQIISIPAEIQQNPNACCPVWTASEQVQCFVWNLPMTKFSTGAWQLKRQEVHQW